MGIRGAHMRSSTSNAERSEAVRSTVEQGVASYEHGLNSRRAYRAGARLRP